MSKDRSEPETEEGWRVKALNVHGLFLEQWVADTIRRSEYWTVVGTRVPIGFDGGSGLQHGEIDVLAERPGKKVHLTVPIECKKNNPDFIEWVFFEKQFDHPVAALRHDRQDYPNNPGLHRVTEGVARLNVDAPITVEAREVRGTYLGYKAGDKTKTANDSISDAARQVALAYESLVRADLATGDSATATRMDRRIFIPMIVTTAHLATVKVDPSLIADDTGEIPLDGVTFKSCDTVLYEYPIPYALQRDRAIVTSTGEFQETIENRLGIVVIKSTALPGLMQEIDVAIRSGTFVHQEAD